MEIQIDSQNVMGIGKGTCDHTKLVSDMQKVACMVVKKYRYPYSLIEDVVSESLVFLFSHVDRIPTEAMRVNSYVLALSRSIFRRFLFSSKDNVSQEESEYRLQVVASVFREVGNVDEFHEIVGKVFRSYCFAPFLSEFKFKIALEDIDALSSRPSFRHLFLNAYNRLRYDRIDNVVGEFRSRNDKETRKASGAARLRRIE